MPLSDMLVQGLIEAGDINLYKERQTKRQLQELDLLEKQRQMQDAQRLRELYSSGRQPSMQEIMSASPQLGIEMQKAQFQNMYQMQQMEKLQREKQEANAKTYAQYVGPIADTYFDDINQGMKPEMAKQKFHSAIGAAQKELEEKHGIMPTGDFSQFTPEQVLQRSTGLGVPSRHFTRQEELQKRYMPPAITSEQYHGSVVNTPYGPMYQPPLPNSPMNAPSGGMQQPEINTQKANHQHGEELANLAAQDIPTLEARLNATRDPQQRQMIWQTLTDKKKQTQGGAGFVTPEQMPELKAQEAAAKKKAELNAQAEHEAEQQLSSLEALDAQNVESLIDQSFHSKPEALAKGEYGLSGMAGMSTEANTAYKELVVIEAQMRDMAKAIVGAGPISEGEQKIIKDALGGVSTPGDADSRKKAYRKFVNLAKEKISRYPHLAQQMKAIQETAGQEDLTKQQGTSSAKALKIGDIHKGMEYQGGNPNDKSNWKKVQ